MGALVMATIIMENVGRLSFWYTTVYTRYMYTGTQLYVRAFLAGWCLRYFCRLLKNDKNKNKLQLVIKTSLEWMWGFVSNDAKHKTAVESVELRR